MKDHGRHIVGLNSSWSFRLDPERMGFNTGWPLRGLPNSRPVNVPHTWNVEDGSEEYKGLGWYEYRFPVPIEWEGMTVRIRFEAIYRDATIWLNGNQVGIHFLSGYTPFVIDLSPFIRPGEENMLVVSVDNSHSQEALPANNSFDWADDGGIIREASLLVTGQASVDYMKIDAMPSFPDDDEEPVQGIVDAEIAMWGELPTNRVGITAEMAIVKDGRIQWNGTYRITDDSDRIRVKGIMLESVELWHFDHPHLYEFQLRLIQNGRISDETSSYFGFRELRTVGNKLWLNREPVRLAGVEWMPGSNPDKGLAESERDWIQALTQLKEANCVFTRFHWQQDEKILEWCDRNGMLLQEEIPHWQQPSEPDAETIGLAKLQAEEMILRHYNHPCIFAWGMGNELNGQSQQTTAYMSELKTYIQLLDPTRMVNYVSNTMHVDPAKDASCVGDLLMWNDYVGTWYGEHDLHGVLERIQQSHNKPLVISEFGLCEPAFSGGDERRIAILQEKLESYRQHQGIAAVIYFSLNDYRTQLGEDGSGKYRKRVHGSTDLYGNVKPSYYFLRDVLSPVVVESISRETGGQLLCRIRCRNDIPSYAVSGYQLIVCDKQTLTERAAAVPAMKPGQLVELSIPFVDAPKGKIRIEIHRSTGFRAIVQEVEIFRNQ